MADKKFRSKPCKSCGHRAVGIETATGGFLSTRGKTDPPEDCDCPCHAAWRMVNRVPALVGPAKEAD